MGGKWGFLDPNRLGPRDGRRVLTNEELYPGPREVGGEIVEGGGALVKWYPEMRFDHVMLVDQVVDFCISVLRALDWQDHIRTDEINLTRNRLIYEMDVDETVEIQEEWDHIDVTQEEKLREWGFNYRINWRFVRNAQRIETQPVMRYRLRGVPHFRDAQIAEQEGWDQERDGADPIYMDLYTNGMYEIFRRRSVPDTSKLTDKEKAERFVLGRFAPPLPKMMKYVSVDSGFFYRNRRGDRNSGYQKMHNGEVLLWNGTRGTFTRRMSLEAVGMLLGLVFPELMRFIASRSATKRVVGQTVKEKDGSLGMDILNVPVFAESDETEVEGYLWTGDKLISSERGRDLEKVIGKRYGELRIYPYEVTLGAGRVVCGGVW